MPEKLLDHAVPADLVELHEIIEWREAIAKIGMPGNTAGPSSLVGQRRAVVASITAPVISRAQAGLRSPLSTSGNITPGGPNGGNTDHYGGDPLNGFPWDHGRCASIWRAYQAYHMDHNGWVDIAYTGGVCIHGYIFVGRWFGVRTAANGNDTGNQDTYAWCYMAGKGQPLTDAAKVAYLDAHALAISAGAGSNVWPHHHWFQTDCPGSDVDAWLNAGLPRPGGVPPVPPTQPADPHARINAPVTGMTHTPSGRGYVLVAADGGVFCFGDAAYHGSLPQIGVRPNQPIVGVSITPSGGGYWLASADGGVYAFGDAGFYGSAGGMHINAPVCGIDSTPTGAGYYLPSTDGGIFSYGDAAFYGSAA